ncbi:DUF2391 domain-containing protein [Rhodocaloribacter litoris]|uniref:DUF2391 domain-containing protein n=1 Tax=Rhodocaloribacter litoris TaxID=2558931 RepID=UPI00142376A0|nr:DUF2391 domain-containing protein [Rhodocaloribacter litoris]QXD13773.1 DUF2391 domain-containing protein [Rhodocaloribacter litoris]
MNEPLLQPAAEQAVPPRPRIEIGLMVAGRFDAVDRAAIQLMRKDLLATLQTLFPAFTWRLPVVRRRELYLEAPAEPVDLIERVLTERDAYRWDLGMVVTSLDLRSHFKPYMVGAPASSLDVAVLSTARLDPLDALEGDDEESVRTALLARRLKALALHLFGHLNELPHQEDPEDVMYDFNTVEDLDRMHRLADRERLEETLREVADQRLEETEAYRRGGQRLGFALRVLWRERRNLTHAVREVEPWRFPLRFSRMTTAAVSTLLVFLLTAEAWEFGMGQPPGRMAGLALAALVGASTYVLHRQHLLTRRRRARLSEQRVVATLSAVVAVALGLVTTYGLLFGMGLAAGLALFAPEVVQAWTASLGSPPALRHYLVLAAFLATLGLLTGALGASFEEEHYFRHVLLLDEET